MNQKIICIGLTSVFLITSLSVLHTEGKATNLSKSSLEKHVISSNLDPEYWALFIDHGFVHHAEKWPWQDDWSYFSWFQGLEREMMKRGWEEDHISTLFCRDSDINKVTTDVNIINELELLNEKSKAGDIIFIYFSMSVTNMLDARDTEPRDENPIDEEDNMDEAVWMYAVSENGYDNPVQDAAFIKDDTLAEKLNDLSNSGKKIILVFDGDNRALEMFDGSADFNNENTVILLASMPDYQLCYGDWTEYHTGFFTFGLIYGIMLGEADYNGNKWISAEELFEYANEEVERLNREMGHNQKPFIIDRYPSQANSKDEEFDFIQVKKTSNFKYRIFSLPIFEKVRNFLLKPLKTSVENSDLSEALIRN